MQDIEKLVFRLKKEKKDVAKKDAEKVKVVKEISFIEVEKKGFLGGIEDAYKMKYTEYLEFQFFVNIYAPDHVFHSHASKQTKEKLDRLLDYTRSATYKELSSNEHLSHQPTTNDIVEEVFSRGWTDGVLHIWNQVKDKLD